MSLSWRIDPGAVAPPWQPLFKSGSEHGRAVARLLAQSSARALPDEAWLHLHGYELLEQLNVAVTSGARQVQFPFWPACLFAAADVRAHGARELAACMPVAVAVTCVLPTTTAVIAAALREFGELRFDPERYRWALRSTARALGWVVEEMQAMPLPPLPVPLLDERRRAAAGAVLLERGRLLLERRPDAARVYAGLWDTPGGHLEPGESPQQALVRELDEELGIDVQQARLVLVQDDRDPTSGTDYRHFVHVVDQWQGAPRPRRGQRLLALPWGDVLRLHCLNPLVASALWQLLESGDSAFG